MRRNGWLSVVACAVAFGLVASSFAAEKAEGKGEAKGAGRGGRGMGPGMGMFQGPSKVSLANIAQVQTELKVTPEQKDKIAELAKGIAPQRPEGQQGLSQEERRKRMADMQETRKKAVADAEKKLADILKPEQMKRLDEIAFQQKGIQALKDAEVAKTLKITDDQTKKIDEAIQAGNEERRKLFSNRGAGKSSAEDRQAMQEKMQQIQKDVEAKAVGALNADQKAQYEKLKGAPFKLEARPMGQGQGRGGAGRGAGKKST